MECSICKSEDVPVSDGADDRQAGTYLKESYIPFSIGVPFSPVDTSNLFRIKIQYPKERPLCRKCRRDLILKGFGVYEEGK